MERKNLHFKIWSTLFLFSVVFSSTVFGQSATLTHSYNFEDGTVKDLVGSADGALNGNAAISNGELVLTGGYATLPGKQIDVPSYGSLSIESVFKQSAGLSGFTCVYAIGKTDPSTDRGNDYLIWQPTRGDNVARTAIATKNATDPWATENGVNTTEITDTATHYAVTVLTATDIKLYLDGQLIGSDPLTGSNALDSISNDTILIGASVYSGDPRWNGSVKQLNIYNGELDEATIAQHTQDYLGVNISDATLDTLYTNTGTLDPAFDSSTDLYQLTVPYGTSSVKFTAVPKVKGATVEMFDGLGNDFTSTGTVSFPADQGIDVAIKVTALDGSSEKEYDVAIYPGVQSNVATLSSIDLSVGALTTDFELDSTSYTAILPYGTTSVDVTGVPSWDKATVTGDGTIDVSSGSATTAITVTSEDGTTTMTYNLDLYVTHVTTGKDFYIQHEQSGFVVDGVLGSEPVIDNALKDQATQLWQFVESGVTGQYFIQNQEHNYIENAPVSDGAWHFVIKDALPSDLDSARFILNEYAPGMFKIISVKRQEMDAAKNMMGTNDANVNSTVYSDKWAGSSWDNDGLTIWNIKNPEEVVSPYDTHLSALTIDGDTINGFDPFNLDYNITLPVGTTSINLGAVPLEGTSTVTGTGTVDVTSGDSVVVMVTATDPSYKTQYVIHYMIDVPLTLTHSYTFADGTAQDVVGNADGTVHGGMISDGVYTTSENGEYISFPGEDIAINTYPSITVEAYLVDVDSTTNDANTMITYFGNTNSSNYGENYFFTSLKARAAVSCLNSGSPWSAETGVSSASILDDGLPHHIVSVLNNDSVSLYIDGLLAGAGQMSAANKIANLSNALAYLCKSGYTGDKTWLGQVLEYNIYEGQMDAQTIATRAYDYPVEDSTMDATLSALMVDGDTIQGFASYNLMYDDSVTEGTTTVPTITATPKNANASVEVTAASAISGTTTIVVTAEDGVTKNTYTVNFPVKGTKSSDASLADLQVAGATVTGFDAATMTYDVELAAGTTTVPVVAATTTDANATVEMTDATAIPGTTTIVVTAEDGNTTSTYTINFKLATGVANIEQNAILVYPTVTTTSFKVKTTSKSSVITVYNMVGNVITKQLSNDYEKTITVSSVGMYILKVESNGVTKTFKVIKSN